MIIDKSHRPWIVFSALVLLIATALYVLYARSADNGPTGGSWQGLLFGIAGSALMIFAGLLAARKKVPRWPIGSAQMWLRAHIWLGLLSLPCILFHAGFRFGGLLEQVLLIVFALVVGSGIVGLVFQSYLPSVIKTSTPREAMFEQIPAVCDSLRRTADERVVAICGSLFESAAAEPTIPPPPETEPENQTLREFYVSTVRPFLSADANGESTLSNPSHAGAVFSQVQQTLPKRMHAVLSELDSICDERRQLAKQVRLHRWLHLWLFLHVPLSLSLLVLGIVHAVAAVYY